jgi:ribosomal protein L30/L7E
MAKKDEIKADGTIKIQYYRSIDRLRQETERRWLKALGITKLNQTVEREDSPSMPAVSSKRSRTLLRIVE